MTVAADQLRAFIDRILRLKEEQDTLADDIREVYAEAKDNGFDKTAMGQLVAHLRKKTKDAAKFEEQSAIFSMYLESYEQRPSHAHTREGKKIDRATEGSIETGSEAAENARQAPATIAVPGSVSDAGAGEIPATDFQPPAFLLKAQPTMRDYRPHCQEPTNCASYKAQHCYSCAKAAGLVEAAA